MDVPVVSAIVSTFFRLFSYSAAASEHSMNSSPRASRAFPIPAATITCSKSCRESAASFAPSPKPSTGSFAPSAPFPRPSIPFFVFSVLPPSLSSSSFAFPPLPESPFNSCSASFMLCSREGSTFPAIVMSTDVSFPAAKETPPPHCCLTASFLPRHPQSCTVL